MEESSPPPALSPPLKERARAWQNIAGSLSKRGPTPLFAEKMHKKGESLQKLLPDGIFFDII